MSVCMNAYIWQIPVCMCMQLASCMHACMHTYIRIGGIEIPMAVFARRSERQSKSTADSEINGHSEKLNVWMSSGVTCASAKGARCRVRHRRCDCRRRKKPRTGRTCLRAQARFCDGGRPGGGDHVSGGRPGTTTGATPVRPPELLVHEWP